MHELDKRIAEILEGYWFGWFLGSRSLDALAGLGKMSAS
jgi:hypothetical protein